MKLKLFIVLSLFFMTKLALANAIGFMFTAGHDRLILGKNDLAQLCIGQDASSHSAVLIISIVKPKYRELEKILKKNKGQALKITYKGAVVSEAKIKGRLPQRFILTDVPVKTAKSAQAMYQAPCLVAHLQ